MADTLLGLVPDPLAVIANIFGQSLSTIPDPVGIAVRIHRRPAGEFRRYLNQGLGDQHWYRVQIGAVSTKAEALRLKRDRATATERVVHRRRLLLKVGQYHLRVGFGGWLLAQTPGDGAGDFPTGLIQDVLVGRSLPRHHRFNDFVKTQKRGQRMGRKPKLTEA